MKLPEVEVVIKKYDEEEVLLELPGEDHTLCNLLRWALNQQDGIIATYRVEHPILGKKHKVDEERYVPPKVRIRAVEEGADAREALDRAIEELLELVAEAKEEFSGGTGGEEALKLREVKPEIRVLGVDDGYYGPDDDTTLVVGVVMRGGQWIDGVMCTEVTVDGLDATPKIVEMVNRSKHKPQLRVILTDGITFAGFNVLDIRELHEKTGLPVISVIKHRPDVASVISALDNVDRTEERRRIVLRAGPVHEVRTRRNEAPVYFQCAGIEPKIAKLVLKRTATRHRLPEPIRVAHFIATGVTRGESSSDA